jgi:hypothetical protein
MCQGVSSTYDLYLYYTTVIIKYAEQTNKVWSNMKTVPPEANISWWKQEEPGRTLILHENNCLYTLKDWPECQLCNITIWQQTEVLCPDGGWCVKVTQRNRFSLQRLFARSYQCALRQCQWNTIQLCHWWHRCNTCCHKNIRQGTYVGNNNNRADRQHETYHIWYCTEKPFLSHIILWGE